MVLLDEIFHRDVKASPFSHMAQILPSSINSSQSLSPNSAPPTEYCILFMGTWHKQSLFHQMQMAAHKFEQHIQYADTCYLTFQFGLETIVLELIDPGTEHTGAREMSIRKADAAILCYAAYSPASFHTLASIAEDFKCLEEGIQPVSLLLCNEDQLVEYSEPDEGEKTDGSEEYGFASNTAPKEEIHPIQQSARRHSMERIRLERDAGQCPVTREKGEQLARQFGENCEFHAISFSSIQPNLHQIIQQLIDRAKKHRQSRERSRSRSRTSSKRLSPIIPILRRTSLKKLLGHSKSDAKQSSEMVNNLANEENGRKKNSSLFENALRVLVHPREHTKSQNKVADVNESESTKSTPTLEGAETTEKTPFGLEVIPPSGEPCSESFAFDPVRVNNFVSEREGERQQAKRGSLATTKTQPITNQQKGGYRLREISTPTNSAACTIQ